LAHRRGDYNVNGEGRGRDREEKGREMDNKRVGLG
jgi:hypothetical protein